jgi:mono/diheme cytochrome c family protein
MSLRNGIISLSVLVTLATLSLAGCPTQTPAPTGGDPIAGQTVFEQLCVTCHDPASIAAARDRITNNMGTINAQMDGITLTNEQVTDLQAYLATQ